MKIVKINDDKSCFLEQINNIIDLHKKAKDYLYLRNIVFTYFEYIDPAHYLISNYYNIIIISEFCLNATELKVSHEIMKGFKKSYEPYSDIIPEAILFLYKTDKDKLKNLTCLI